MEKIELRNKSGAVTIRLVPDDGHGCPYIELIGSCERLLFAADENGRISVSWDEPPYVGKTVIGSDRAIVTNPRENKCLLYFMNGILHQGEKAPGQDS